MSFEEYQFEFNRLKDAGIQVTVGQFARLTNRNYKRVVVKPYQYKLLREASKTLSILA